MQVKINGYRPTALPIPVGRAVGLPIYVSRFTLGNFPEKAEKALKNQH